MNNRCRAKKGATAITSYQRGLDSNSGSDDIYIYMSVEFVAGSGLSPRVP